MSKMKAVVLTGPRRVEIADVDRPEIQPDEVLTRTLFTSISPGTYIQRFLGMEAAIAAGEVKYPFIGGYLNVGEVVEVGSRVKNCRCGDILNVLCFVRQTSHALYNGSDAEFQAVKAENPYLIKLAGDPRHSAFNIIGTTGLSAMLEANPHADQSVMIFGQGMVGLGCTRAFWLRGCRPIVTADLMEKRLALSRAMGAHDARNMKTQSTEQILADYPKGFDCVIETTGNSKMIEPSLHLAKNRVIVVSLYHQPVSFSLTGKFHANRMNISSNKLYHGTIPMAYHLVDRGCFDVEQIISDIIRPEDSPWAYEALLNGPEKHLGILIDWRKTSEVKERLWHD